MFLVLWLPGVQSGMLGLPQRNDWVVVAAAGHQEDKGIARDLWLQSLVSQG